MNQKQKSATNDGKSWQKTKSEQTKTAILNAALDCFLAIGFNSTTTEKIAKQANVSRGAMLHHFPQRSDLIQASVGHLHRKRLEAFEDTLSKLNENADFTLVGEGIDAFWDQLQSPLFAVYCELLVASRTDAELKGTLEPAIRDFQTAWREKSEGIFPDLAQSEQYGLATALTRYLLEGIAFNAQISDGQVQHAQSKVMIEWLKSTVREMFQDVQISKSALTAAEHQRK
ncbi:MAG: TetR/AcrR family transcriptional regulator [Pseudomonadales bacterium]|nr:TetR/AcrR family transcriptional regulator [Pseudomonadales bacterium]